VPTTVQLNTRIDPEVKRQGDAVFARAGLTPSDVVRALWQTTAEMQRVPECISQRINPQKAQRLRAIEEGAGIAMRVAEEQGIRFEASYTEMDYAALRDEMYDEMLARMEEDRV